MRALLATLCGSIVLTCSAFSWGWFEVTVNVPDPMALMRAFMPTDVELLDAMPKMGGPTTMTAHLSAWNGSSFVDVLGVRVPAWAIVVAGAGAALALALSRRRMLLRVLGAALALAALVPAGRLMWALMNNEPGGYGWPLPVLMAALLLLIALALVPQRVPAV